MMPVLAVSFLVSALHSRHKRGANMIPAVEHYDESSGDDDPSESEED